MEGVVERMHIAPFFSNFQGMGPATEAESYVHGCHCCDRCYWRLVLPYGLTYKRRVCVHRDVDREREYLARPHRLRIYSPGFAWRISCQLARLVDTLKGVKGNDMVTDAMPRHPG